MKNFTLKTMTALLAGMIGVGTATAAGTIEDFQKKVDKIAAEHGIPAPDVKAEITADVKSNVRNGETKQELEQREETRRRLSNVSPIERIVDIDVNTIRAIKARDGKILYIADNGRFAFVGTMVDVWNRKELTTIEDIEEAVSRIDLARMGFQIEKVNHISIGDGKKHVTVFADPQCGWCHRLISEINRSDKFKTDFTFDIVILPILGERSVAMAKSLYCAKTNDDAQKFEAFKGGARAIEKLEQKQSCDEEDFNNTSVIAQALGIQAVPMIIAFDGRFERGKPHDLEAFLYNKVTKSDAAPVLNK